MRIREAQPDDLLRLLEIEADAGLLFLASDHADVAGDGRVHEDAFRPWTLAGACWVADAEETAVGFAACEAFEDGFHLWQVSVAGSHQGRGIGRALVEATIRAARQRGLPAVTLTTFRDVAWNAPFYASLGFRELAPQALNLRLQQVLAAEAELGLDMTTRCAMRLAL